MWTIYNLRECTVLIEDETDGLWKPWRLWRLVTPDYDYKWFVDTEAGASLAAYKSAQDIVEILNSSGAVENR